MDKIEWQKNENNMKGKKNLKCNNVFIDIGY